MVFYNGTSKHPEVEILKLSDSFLQDTDNPDVEITCTVYNINPGNNITFMDKCNTMNEYTMFVEKLREFKAEAKEKGLNLDPHFSNAPKVYEGIVKKAVDYCIAHGILKEFFKERYNEVLKNMTLDMTFEAREKLIERDAYNAGIEQGITQAIIGLVNDKLLQKSEAAKRLGMSEDEFTDLLKKENSK